MIRLLAALVLSAVPASAQQLSLDDRGIFIRAGAGPGYGTFQGPAFHATVDVGYWTWAKVHTLSVNVLAAGAPSTGAREAGLLRVGAGGTIRILDGLLVGLAAGVVVGSPSGLGGGAGIHFGKEWPISNTWSVGLIAEIYGAWLLAAPTAFGGCLCFVASWNPP
jgi:hypothetical protein